MTKFIDYKNVPTKDLFDSIVSFSIANEELPKYAHIKNSKMASYLISTDERITAEEAKTCISN